MTTVLTWDQFEAQYKPQQNHISHREEFGGWLFETYGDDEAYVKDFVKANPCRVWTILDVGYICIGSGFHFVNRLGYVITEIAFGEDEDITVEDEDDKD